MIVKSEDRIEMEVIVAAMRVAECCEAEFTRRTQAPSGLREAMKRYAEKKFEAAKRNKYTASR